MISVEDNNSERTFLRCRKLGNALSGTCQLQLSYFIIEFFWKIHDQHSIFYWVLKIALPFSCSPQ